MSFQSPSHLGLPSLLSILKSIMCSYQLVLNLPVFESTHIHYIPRLNVQNHSILELTHGRYILKCMVQNRVTFFLYSYGSHPSRILTYEGCLTKYYPCHNFRCTSYLPGYTSPMYMVPVIFFLPCFFSLVPHHTYDVNGYIVQYSDHFPSVLPYFMVVYFLPCSNHPYLLISLLKCFQLY